MSSPSSSSSATAGTRRWTRPLRASRKGFIDWSAAAVTAAALYASPVLLLGALVGTGWAIALLAICLALLAAYSVRFGSPLGVLATLVLIAGGELVVRFGTFAADTCGDSRLANDLESAGIVPILIAVGAYGVRRRRVLPLLGALAVAGAWILLVARVVPGGAGGCFN